MLDGTVQPSPELLASIEDLFMVFGRYPLPEKMECCRCGCGREVYAAKLFEKPLRELKKEHLDFYSFAALSTMGNVADFKHFLPRIFELGFAVEPDASLLTNTEILTDKLPYGKWLTWPQEEQDALRRFFHAFWTAALSSRPPVEEMDWALADSWLRTIAQAEVNLGPYMEEWTATDTQEASVLLSSMILYSGLLDHQQPENHSFWGRCRAQFDQLQQWLHSRPVAEKLESAASRWADSEYHTHLVESRKMLG